MISKLSGYMSTWIHGDQRAGDPASKLNPDLMREIFRHFDRIELCQMARVNRCWKDLTEHCDRWHHIFNGLRAKSDWLNNPLVPEKKNQYAALQKQLKEVEWVIKESYCGRLILYGPFFCSAVAAGAGTSMATLSCLSYFIFESTLTYLSDTGEWCEKFPILEGLLSCAEEITLASFASTRKLLPWICYTATCITVIKKLLPKTLEKAEQCASSYPRIQRNIEIELSSLRLELNLI